MSALTESRPASYAIQAAALARPQVRTAGMGSRTCPLRSATMATSMNWTGARAAAKKALRIDDLPEVERRHYRPYRLTRQNVMRVSVPKFDTNPLDRLMPNPRVRN